MENKTPTDLLEQVIRIVRKKYKIDPAYWDFEIKQYYFDEIMKEYGDLRKKMVLDKVNLAIKKLEGSCNLICWQITPQNFLRELKSNIEEELRSEKNGN